MKDIIPPRIDYPSLLLFHIDRILKNINENGVTQLVETSIDALWAAITTELKEERMQDWEDVNSMEITGKTEYEKMRQGKERTLAKLQIVMDVLAENGILYRSTWEEIVEDEIKVRDVDESEGE